MLSLCTRCSPLLHRSMSTLTDPATVHSRILYNDDRILVYDKPPRKAVHGGNRVGKTVLQQMEDANVGKLYTVHRLDKDTTGILIFAKTPAIASHISNMMYKREILRSYLALTIGAPSPLTGTVNGIMGPSKQKFSERHVMSMKYESSAQTRDTQTSYKVLKNYDGALALVELQPHTGIKHQLKVHCAQVLRTPIFGDGKYGSKALLRADLAQRMLKRGMQSFHALHLHANKVLIPNYKNNSDLVITAPLPNHFIDTLERVEEYSYQRGKHRHNKNLAMGEQEMTDMAASDELVTEEEPDPVKGPSLDRFIPQYKQDIKRYQQDSPNYRPSNPNNQRQAGSWKRGPRY